MASRSGFAGTWRRRVALVLMILAAIPPAQILIVKWWNPALTTVMLQRAWQYPDWPREIDWMDLHDMPGDLVWFAIASEDGRFFEHRGIDWIEFRSVVETWQDEGTAPRGASTITMQAARSLFLWQGRSHLRKILELYYAVWMEVILGKRRVLELYLNVLETGPGVYGMNAGARYHFNRTLARTTRSQRALLVAILPNPLEWSAAKPSSRVRSRQARILRNALRWRQPEPLAPMLTKPQSE